MERFSSNVKNEKESSVSLPCFQGPLCYIHSFWWIRTHKSASRNRMLHSIFDQFLSQLLKTLLYQLTATLPMDDKIFNQTVLYWCGSTTGAITVGCKLQGWMDPIKNTESQSPWAHRTCLSSFQTVTSTATVYLLTKLPLDATENGRNRWLHNKNWEELLFISPYSLRETPVVW